MHFMSITLVNSKEKRNNSCTPCLKYVVIVYHYMSNLFIQWRILTNLIADLHGKKPYLLSIQPCFEHVGHQEFLNNFECRECVPFSGIRQIIPLTNNDNDDDDKNSADNFQDHHGYY